MNQHKVLIDTEKCIGCGLCGKVCVAGNPEIHHHKAAAVMNACLMCGHCSAVCPKKAISIIGFEKDQMEKTKDNQLNPDHVLDAIRFRRSGPAYPYGKKYAGCFFCCACQRKRPYGKNGGEIVQGNETNCGPIQSYGEK